MKQKELLTQLRSLTAKKLSDKIVESRKQLTTLRQQQVLGTLKNPREITVVRKSIAQMASVMDQKLTEILTSEKPS